MVGGVFIEYLLCARPYSSTWAIAVKKTRQGPRSQGAFSLVKRQTTNDKTKQFAIVISTVMEINGYRMEEGGSLDRMAREGLAK